MATQLDGAAIALSPTVAGVINGTNGILTAIMPTASGALLISTWLGGAVIAPMPTVAGSDVSFKGAVVAPIPTLVADLLMGWDGAGAVIAPFPKVAITMSKGWVGAATAPMPVVNALLAASIPIMGGAVTVTAFPMAFGILSGEVVDTFTVMVMNLKNRLVSFYQNYDFNSVCPFNGSYIGAGSDGIYEFTGADDAGVDIAASILFGDANFGTDYIKTNPEIFVNYSGNGPLQVSVTTDQYETSGPYEVPEPLDTKLETNRAMIPQGLRGTYYQYLIENVDGSIVNIQNIRLKFLKSQRTMH